MTEAAAAVLGVMGLQIWRADSVRGKCGSASPCPTLLLTAHRRDDYFHDQPEYNLDGLAPAQPSPQEEEQRFIKKTTTIRRRPISRFVKRTIGGGIYSLYCIFIIALHADVIRSPFFCLTKGLI